MSEKAAGFTHDSVNNISVDWSLGGFMVEAAEKIIASYVVEAK